MSWLFDSLLMSWLRATRAAYRAIKLARVAQVIAYQADRRSQKMQRELAELHQRLSNAEFEVSEANQRAANAIGAVCVVHVAVHTEAEALLALRTRVGEMEDKFASRTDVMASPSLN